MSATTTLTKLIMAAGIVSLSACSTMASKGADMSASKAVSMVSAADAPLGYKCWNGCMKLDLADCPPEPQPIQEVQCWDGSIVSEVSQCPVQQTVACWDGSLVNDASQCPAQPVTRSNMSVASLCGQEYRSETIYYEFDKGRSAETQSKIDRILDIGEFCNVESITVVGHTDTSGSAYRGDGVKEPLNRRTEVLIKLSETGAMMMNN